jgi:hypothetical protein
MSDAVMGYEITRRFAAVMFERLRFDLRDREPALH